MFQYRIYPQYPIYNSEILKFLKENFIKFNITQQGYVIYTDSEIDNKIKEFIKFITETYGIYTFAVKHCLRVLEVN